MKISQFLKKLVYCHFLRDTWINNIKNRRNIRKNIMQPFFIFKFKKYIKKIF